MLMLASSPRQACDEQRFLRYFRPAYGSVIDRRHRRPAPDLTAMTPLFKCCSVSAAQPRSLFFLQKDMEVRQFMGDGRRVAFRVAEGLERRHPNVIRLD